MRTLVSILACSIALASASVSAQAPAARTTKDLRATVDELLAVDRGFAVAAAKTDMITGISAMFDAEVIAPVPGGKFARNKSELVEAMRSNPANRDARAAWKPVKAGISGDGQQGFTLGYMDIADQGKPAPRLSKYLAYWARRPEGWRVIAYKREPRPAGPVSSKMIAPSIPSRAMRNSGGPAAIQKYEQELRAAESEFSDAAGNGFGTALKKFGSAESISLGSAPEVTIGIEAMARLNLPATARWSADGARVAASGDRGFTWGVSRLEGPQPPGQQPGVFPFFAVWKRAGPDSGWRVIAR